ncbi:MAG: holo-[acyl-carrier-protein] synthase [Lentisphaerae bacterium RIFOXYA12_FULL_60_10]|nr:MAG: holo-[acyl-carrier-protein] synthase [Lentisphaerae bacterium RIFOXYA12_FULL_60_10]
MIQPAAVLGIGVDLVENDRMGELIDRWGARFVDRVFLSGERKYCNTKAVPARHYAGRFAVKEAVSKAFGTGLGPHLGWLDIEVVRDADTGAPSVHFSERARRWADSLGVGQVLISLSHTAHYAMAQALLLSSPAP